MTNNWREDFQIGPPYYWEESWGISAAGVARKDLLPPLQEAFIRELGNRAWKLMGRHWHANKRAFIELNKMLPDGMAAMAKYCSRHLLKRLPETGVTEQVFWDEYMLYMLRMDHKSVEQDETLAAYLKSRIAKPGWDCFIKSFVQTMEGKESPEFAHRFLLCTLWDLYPMPLRFWADSAASELLSGVCAGFNLDKIRNTRRELGLKRNALTVVKVFARKPPLTPSDTPMLHIEMDDRAAKRSGLSAIFPAFCEYLKGDGEPGL